MFCNNVSLDINIHADNVSVFCNCMIVTGYVLIGEIACDKYPVLLLLWSTDIISSLKIQLTFGMTPVMFSFSCYRKSHSLNLVIPPDCPVFQLWYWAMVVN